ncbi:GNAT family N-acetyltransferase [Pyxidicoccus fallax]|uniref:Alanine--tRNA ligase n=1 Tax=Pyxidicoccus fallax TaxID=394095 RepID=A0A848L9C0_9BACT|nr:DHHA1 domain-containing protein [Pyxidicoccus fallax]NMO14852.1 GNAT family N-acetyltransferase [Pyxidicoccus fallax]NPC79702.1 GNAT family N-acetyltransferase [Pyxidicoccus fallax]
MILYDESTLARIPWPETPEGRFARDYLGPLVRDGSTALVSDRTTYRIIGMDGLLIPVAINDAEHDNSPLFSTYARYVTAQLAMMDARKWGGASGFAIRRVLEGLGLALKAARIDRCVYVDHWLVLRNLNARLTADQVRRLTAFLAERFPGHAILFPSVNTATHSPLLNTLRQEGYGLVYAFHTRMLLPFKAEVSRQVRENHRRDARLLEAAGYQLLDGADVPGCAPRLLELYRALNEEKYSTNMRITQAFFESALRDRTMRFRVAVKDGRIDGFYAFTVNEDVVFSPWFGYEMSLPQEVGLYRGLVYQLMQEALEHGLTIELGAGADEFKSRRGDKPVPRYTAVHTGHLPAWRRAGWRLLQRFANEALLPSSRSYLRSIDGDGVVGFDGVPEVFTPPTGPSPREAADALRQELTALERALEDASTLEGEALVRALTPLSEKLHNWPQPTRRVMELRGRLEALEQRQRRKVSAKAPASAVSATEEAQRLLAGAARLGDTALVAHNLRDASSKHLKDVVECLKQHAGSAAVVLAATRGEKVVLVTAATQALLQRGVDAGQLMARVAPAVDGKGGGAPEVAWGGGSRPDGIDAALEAARRYLDERLGGKA